MGGAEFGAVDRQGIQDALMIHREVALEIATERAQGCLLPFRRSRVFEKTFQRIIKETNGLTGICELVDRYAPEGYLDPYAQVDATSVES